MESDNEHRLKILPWVEKYRPKQLSELISHDEIVRTIERFIEKEQLPHLLFYGPAGTGKTSTILAVAKQLYSAKEFGSMVLELNASDDRGIGVIRNQVQTFASTRNMFSNRFKLIILDEADSMTRDAQNALRRIMERYSENVRFCLICNYLSRIIPAIQSRCTRFRFAPLNRDQILPRLEHVIAAEQVKVSDDGRRALLELSEGDMRRVLNVVQSTWMAFGDVSEQTVYKCVGYPLPKEVESMINWLLNENFRTCYENITELKTLRGLALQDILTQVHLFAHRIDFPTDVRIRLLAELADVEYRLASGTSEKIQLGSLVACFQTARRAVLAQA